MDPKTARSDSVSTASSLPFLPTVSERRGSSPKPLFASLHEIKRPNDPRAQARRQSLQDQRPAPGVFGKMWNTWFRGAAS